MKNIHNQSPLQHPTKFKDLNIKDKLGYISAFILMFSGIIIAFASFFITENNDIHGGVLIYIAQALTISASIICGHLYIKSKWLEIDNRTTTMVEEQLKKLLKTDEVEEVEKR